MEQKTIGSVPITNDTLQKLLNRILKDDLPEKDDYIRVLTESLQGSEPACRYLFKVHLGEELPIAPAIGTMGFIHVERLGWGKDKEKYKNSKHCRHGYIPCTVEEYRGLNNYSQLTVSIPDLDNDQESTSVYINIEDFFEDI